MFKKIALAAFAAASLSAFGQDSTSNTSRSDWAMKYDTYHIGTTDLSTASRWDLMRIVHRDLRDANAADAYTISNFLDRLPADQSEVVLKALATNFKQASMVRDEVAQSRFGTDATYTWMSYPPLTWSSTPGQNSWTSVTFSDNGTTSTTTTTTVSSDSDNTIAMTDDSSRPMRMVMSNRGARDIDYDRALSILGSGLGDNERGVLHEIFHPQMFDPNTYSNARELDAIIHVIASNAGMVDHLGRWSWYRHFDTNYYTGQRNW